MDRKSFIINLLLAGVILIFFQKIFNTRSSFSKACYIDFNDFIGSIPESSIEYANKSQDINYIDNKIKSLNRVRFNDFKDEISNDYKRKNTIEINGWVISQTEINLIERSFIFNCN